MAEIKQKSIVIVVLWFGPWPKWIRFFLESCRWNPTIGWLIVTDAPTPNNLPSNVRLKLISFTDYRALIAQKLQIKPKWSEPYKLCDIRPAVGFLHEAEIAGNDYFGYGDLDVIYGDIRRFYTDEVLSHSIVSTHEGCVGGHFTLVRNTPDLREAFRLIRGWKYLLSHAKHTAFDEGYFSGLFLPTWNASWLRRRFIRRFIGNGLFVERFSTNIAPLKWADGGSDWPKRWFFRRGHLTTDRSGDQEFLYLHFSNWQTSRWTDADVAPWDAIDQLVRIEAERPDCFAISASGIESIADDAPLQQACDDASLKPSLA
jgi:hypothetical protein